MRSPLLFLALAALLAPAALAALPPGVPSAPACSLTPEAAPGTLGACVVENPSMESCEGCASNAGGVPAGWEPYFHPGGCGAERVSWTTDVARTGDASVRVDDVADDCFGFVTEPIPIVPGLTYRASFWAKGATTARATVFIAYYLGADEDQQSYLAKYPTRRNTTSEWTEFAVTAPASPAATHARIWAYADQSSTGTFFVDDAALRIVTS